MRDVKRIKPFMDKLTKEWEKYPDLRFIQFVNLIFDNAEYDPFYYEEKDILKLLAHTVEYFEEKEVSE